MKMTKTFKLASVASATAALLIVLPLSRTVKNSSVASAAAATSTADAANARLVQNARIYATQAAYFDGVFQGKLAASQNLEPHITKGRWSAQADKDAFAVGYQDGYALAHAENKTSVPAQ
jgi:hypothetical protein